MASPKFPECETCYFNDREPAICEGCEDASEYEPDENLEDLREMLGKTVFMMKKVA